MLQLVHGAPVLVLLAQCCLSVLGQSCTASSWPEPGQAASFHHAGTRAYLQFVKQQEVFLALMLALLQSQNWTCNYRLVPNQEGVCQRCILSPSLFNLYAEYIMRNTGLDEAQAGIRIAGRNISNLRYADDTTLMAESKELKSLLMNMKEESEKVGLKLNIQTTKIMASGPITSWKIDGEAMETVTDYFLGLQNQCRW